VPVTKKGGTFSSIGNTLYGELFAPEKPKALVVLVFGSGQDSAVTYNYVQHLLPMYDIAVFAYDKRGTGRSNGRFTVDFSELADDALAAVAYARKLLDAPGVPVGLMGESQGGWIAPLAAARAPADFVVVSYGLAISPLDEDRYEVFDELRAKGYDDSVMAKGRELTSITGRIMLSRFTDGLGRPAQVQGRACGREVAARSRRRFHRSAAELTRRSVHRVARRAWLRRDFRLRRAGGAAPGACADALGRRRQGHGSAERADARIPARPAACASAARHCRLPNADHGILEEGEEGGQPYARQSAGYFDLLTHWIQTRKLEGKFGTAILQPDPMNKGSQ
jgi:pimeloyl-ACP methyl ester carboxylesterase